MNLRQRFVARALKFAGAADLFDNMRRDRRGKGGRQQRNDARLLAIEGETARGQPFPSEFREQSAAPEREARLGKCHFTMKGAAKSPIAPVSLETHRCFA
jgi:hypothetical protein